MKSYNLTVVLSFMVFVMSNAKGPTKCPIESREDNGKLYIATNNGSFMCFIDITRTISNFCVKDSGSLDEVLFRIMELEGDMRLIDTDITNSVTSQWTRIESVTNEEIVIGNTRIPVPQDYRVKILRIFIKGQLLFRNQSNCLEDIESTTTSKSTTTNILQSIPPEPATEGHSHHWWLYGTIGILLVVIVVLIIIMAMKRRRKLGTINTEASQHSNNDTSTLQVPSWTPQVPNFYGEDYTSFHNDTNVEENIYEEPDLDAISKRDKEIESSEVKAGQEMSMNTESASRRGSRHESENSIYGCITGRDNSV